MLATRLQTTLDWSAVAAQTDFADIQAAADALLDTAETFTPRASTTPSTGRRECTARRHGAARATTSAASCRGCRRRSRPGSLIDFLKEQDHDAKGQRQFARYGNEVVTRYFYDPKTFRLTAAAVRRRRTRTRGLQDLHYTYDPVGNITQVRDDAQQTHFFNNAVVKPEGLYEYDALYQLVHAPGGSGRERRTTRSATTAISTPSRSCPTRTTRRGAELHRGLRVRPARQPHACATLHGRGASAPGRGTTTTPTRTTRRRTNRLTATSAPGDPDGGP